MFEDLVLSSESQYLVLEGFDGGFEVVDLHLMVGFHLVQYLESYRIAVDQRHNLVLQLTVLLLILLQLRLQSLEDQQVSALNTLSLHLLLLYPPLQQLYLLPSLLQLQFLPADQLGLRLQVICVVVALLLRQSMLVFCVISLLFFLSF